MQCTMCSKNILDEIRDFFSVPELLEPLSPPETSSSDEGRNVESLNRRRVRRIKRRQNSHLSHISESAPPKRLLQMVCRAAINENRLKSINWKENLINTTVDSSTTRRSAVSTSCDIKSERLKKYKSYRDCINLRKAEKTNENLVDLDEMEKDLERAISEQKDIQLSDDWLDSFCQNFGI